MAGDAVRELMFESKEGTAESLADEALRGRELEENLRGSDALPNEDRDASEGDWGD